MAYEQKSYEQVSRDYLKPLLVATSGGGGHITAIMGIHGFLSQNIGGALLPFYEPVMFSDKPQSILRKQVELAIRMLYAPVVGSFLHSLLSCTAFPVLPDKFTLEREIKALSHKNLEQRPYVDMLLDVYPAGYEYAAIWNIFQRNDEISGLKKLIVLQARSDSDNEAYVTHYFLEKLKEAAYCYSPYSEIISTQVMGLPGLCNAVLAYNRWLKTMPHLKAPQVHIHQYMTDLPTKGAVHFFRALASLNQEQQEQMFLYAVGITKDIMQYFFPQGTFFKGIFDIPVKDNPMVRPGLKSSAADNSCNFHKPVRISLTGASKAYELKEGELIASILLGSQVGKDSIAYVETLLKKGMDKVFVFGGQSPAIQAEIEQLLSIHPHYKENIIPLSYQSDTELAALMSRSNYIIIRGGGLCVMEQLAMNHNKEQTVLVHHTHGLQGKLTSGISWEDDNVDNLIVDLKKRGIYAAKTTPEWSARDIAKASLIAAMKRNELNTVIKEI